MHGRIYCQRLPHHLPLHLHACLGLPRVFAHQVGRPWDVHVGQGDKPVLLPPCHQVMPSLDGTHLPTASLGGVAVASTG
jgi:hypothetical protein